MFKKTSTLGCEVGQTVEQVAQRGCGVSIPGIIQNLTGHGPGQPAPRDPALMGQLDDLQRCPQQFCKWTPLVKKQQRLG